MKRKLDIQMKKDLSAYLQMRRRVWDEKALYQRKFGLIKYSNLFTEKESVALLAHTQTTE